MNKFIMAAAAALAVAAACSKNAAPVCSDEEPVPIRFTVSDADFDISTKATEVTTASLNSLYVNSTKGAAGSEALAFESSLFSLVDGCFTGSRYWPAASGNYNFYASNTALVFQDGKVHIKPTDVSTDIVCGYVRNAEYKSVPSITLEHIFTRVNNVSVSAESGYSISGISISLSTISPDSGTTYNLNDKVWANTRTLNRSLGSDKSPGTWNANQMFIPGSYSLNVTWTVTKGNYTETLTKTTRPLLLSAGKVNNLSCTLGGDASSVSVSVSVKPWETVNHTIEFE